MLLDRFMEEMIFPSDKIICRLVRDSNNTFSCKHQKQPRWFVTGAPFIQLMMRFTGKVKKTREAFWIRLVLFFCSHVVMVTAAVGHFRTPSLARKASPGLDVIQEPRMGISRHTTHRGKQRYTEWSEAKLCLQSHLQPSLPFTTQSFMSGQS